MTGRTIGRNGRNGAGLTTTIKIKDRDGRVVGEEECVTYKGLLSVAHDEGLKRVATKLLQVPSEENGMTAIVSAEVETIKGVFIGLGDASPGNVNARIRPHVIRMAETRAKARALRDAVNIGVVALEELGDLDQACVVERGDGRDVPSGAHGQSPKASQAKNGNGHETENDRMSESQRRYLFRLLAERGVTGDAAHDRLKRGLGVDSLKDGTRERASELIDMLVGGSGGDGEVAA